MPRPARVPSSGQRRRGRVRHPHRAGAQLRDRAVGSIRQEELLLSGSAEELPDQPVRRTDRHQRLPRRPAGRRHHLAGGHRTCAHGGGHRKADPPGQRHRPHRGRDDVAAGLQPGGRAAGGDRHQAHRGHGGARTADRPRLRHRIAGSVARLGRIGCPDGSGFDAGRLQRQSEAARSHRIRYQDRDQERELAQERRGGGPLRDAAPGSNSGGGRPNRPGDAALPRGWLHHGGTQQGDGAGLPVLSRARPRAGGAECGARRGAAGDHPRAALVASQADSGRLGHLRRGDARSGQQRRHRPGHRHGRGGRAQ